MNKNDYFEFEEEGTDFPFYRDHKLFSKREGVGLLISIILFAFLIFGPVKFYDRQEQKQLSVFSGRLSIPQE